MTYERNVVAGVWAVALAAACVLVDRPAQACGGCFHPVAPRQVTVVTGHRMALSVSPQQTVLWDQIQYSGDPQDFAWVLPVRAGAQIQLSHDEFFAALDALTAPVITGPTPNCSTGGPGFGCGASASSNAAFGAAEPSASGGPSIERSIDKNAGTYTVPDFKKHKMVLTLGGAVRPLAETGIQLEHRGLQQTELRTHFAAFQHL